MTQVIRIDTSDIASIKAALAAGVTTPALLHAWIEEETELVDGAIVLAIDAWHADDGHGISCQYPSYSAQDAVDQYIDDGDWGSDTETTWVDIYVWRDAIDDEGQDVQVDREAITMTFHPEPPPCTNGQHDWQAPWNLLGGLKENPGVWGHGGGVVYTEVCLHCGCGRHTDTWATNPANGRQGLRSERYVPGEFADALEKLADQD